MEFLTDFSEMIGKTIVAQKTFDDGDYSGLILKFESGEYAVICINESYGEGADGHGHSYASGVFMLSDERVTKVYDIARILYDGSQL